MKHVLAAAALLLAAMPAQADILATGSRPGNFRVSTPYAITPLPINSDYQSVTFVTTVPNKIVRVTYNAYCFISGQLNSYVSLTIKVDGVIAAPNDAAAPFCSAAGPGGPTLAASVVRQATIKLPHSGAHSVTISAYAGPITNYVIGASSVVVDE